jgi:AcrR family transcriptional regulator
VSEPRRDGVRDLVVRARREQIVEAATRVFAEKGFRRATTREVARAAGVSEGTIYNYFEDKDALLLAILDKLNETERRAADFEEGMATDFRGFLEQYMRRRMSLIWENREVFRVVLSEMLVNVELRDRYLRHVVDPTMRIAEENFRSRMEQGEVRETDAPLAMRSVAGSVLGVLVLGLLGDEEIDSRSDEVPDILAGLLIHGLGAAEGDRRGEEREGRRPGWDRRARPRQPGLQSQPLSVLRPPAGRGPRLAHDSSGPADGVVGYPLCGRGRGVEG